MKRSVLLLFPLVLGLVSCGDNHDDEVIPNKEIIDKVKTILSKQDLSEFYTKNIKGVFSQEYDVLDISNDDEERTSSYFSYLGRGLFGMYHDLTADEYESIVDEKGNINTFDAIAEGKGYYGLTQVIRTSSFNREDSFEAEINNLDVTQSMTLKSTDDDVWVDNNLWVSNDGIFHYEDKQSLSAIINKNLLFGSVSTRTFREIFSQVDLFDTPGNIEHLDKLYFTICRQLVSKSDKEISDFVKDNLISIKEEDDIEVSFVFSSENIDEEEMEYIIPGAIKGTLFFDKLTYEFKNFSYDIPNKIEIYDEDNGNVKLINTRFYFEGSTSRELPHDEIEPLDPTVYDDVAEFLKDVNEQVVPPIMYL